MFLPGENYQKKRPNKIKNYILMLSFKINAAVDWLWTPDQVAANSVNIELDID
jgi:hypothetical protein